MKSFLKRSAVFTVILFLFLCLCFFLISTKKPVFSVVVTSYNYAKYLPETFDSILAQTYKNYEVVIVDDGSTDNSLQIIKNYTDKHKNFYLYQHDNGINQGLIESMKLGISKAKGKYIAFLESDDIWREDKLAEIAKLIKKYPDAVIISNGAIPFGENISRNLLETQKYLLIIEQKLKEKNDMKPDEHIMFNAIPTFSAVTIKTDIIKELDFKTPKVAVLDLWLYRQIYEKYPLYHTSKTLTKWRKHDTSYGAAENKDTKEEKKWLTKTFEDRFKNNQ